MVFIIYIYALLGFNTSTFSTDTTVYEKALSEIKNTSEFKSISRGKDNYYVSSEILSIYSLGKFYKKEMKNHLVVSEEDFLSMSDVKPSFNNEMTKLGTKKCAKLKIYFSEIKEGVFFSEVLESPKKNEKYIDRPNFGISYLYMFQKRGDEIHLLGVKEIAYN